MNEARKSDSTVGDLKEGDRLGQYTILRMLGRGGMADVYFGMHEGLHRPAAVKVLRPSLAGDQSNLQRFMQEARAAASLVHPNIVQVYDVGQDELPGHGLVRYIAQEYVAGTNLRQYLEQNGALSVRVALSVLLQTLAALKKSSSAGIVHRDIKPENILLNSDGDVKVTDFGLARLLHDDPKLTRAGTTLGTPMYMSPEQLQNGEVDVRSDLYSLGVTLYHMLAGKPPFSGETPLALAMQHVQAQPPNLRELRPDVPKALAQLVERLLAKEPQRRFAGPDEVLEFMRSERSGSLAEHWPEQTIPLPGAERHNGAAPLPATLKLQSQLNRLRTLRYHRWLLAGAIVVLGLIAGAVGGLYAQAHPRPSLFGNSQNMFFGVARQPSVEDQYRLALLSQNYRNRYLWEAVPHFFPPEASASNRLYAGKAWLQIARQLRQQDDEKDRNAAIALLQQIINFNEMDGLVKALAWLELAALWQDAGDEAQFKLAIEQATSSRDRLGADDRETFLQNVPDSLKDMFPDDRSAEIGT
ncbi:MAG: serine/threonine-protein kinase [Aureliella sp.]